MRISFILSILFVVAVTGVSCYTVDAQYAKWIYPIGISHPAPQITIDVSGSPASSAWANQAKALAASWYPAVARLLATENFVPSPFTIRIYPFDGVANAGGGVISINSDWIQANPSDFGVIIHEMTHIIQAYGPNANPSASGWITEGIADYIRYWKFETDRMATNPCSGPGTDSYTYGYGTAANFFAWVTRTYDQRIVPSLDRALRQGADGLPVFIQLTGYDIDTLWNQYKASFPGYNPAVSTSTAASTSTSSSTTTTSSTTSATSATSGGSCVFGLSQKLTNSWSDQSGSYSQYDATITNNGGSAIAGLQFDAPSQFTITQLWNLQSTSTARHYTLPSWMTSIAPGATLTYGYVVRGNSPVQWSIHC